MRKVSTQYFLFYLLIFCLISQLSFGQQGNIWYFGEKAGVNFNTTPPSALTNGVINTLEGSSCISDSTGQLLFYTDGSTVYNKNHQPMPNGSGLNGNYSSAQSAIIIPKPGSTYIYYIFTASEFNHQFLEGYNYNVVDMNLNGGLGDIVQKNVLLYAPGTEKLNAVRHANGIDVWVLTKVTNSNTFKAYKIDCNGINTTPVISSSGNIVPSQNGYSDGGLIKFSPDGGKVCQTFGSTPMEIQLSKFDNITGIVSNSIQWSYPADSSVGNYATVEFSPNSNLLYVGITAQSLVLFNYMAYVKLFQYNITSHAVPAILATETLLFQNQQVAGGALLGWMGFLQLGPDNKIYISRAQLLNIDVINNPNISGIGCNYQQAAVNLGGRLALAGLPTFMPNLFVNQQGNINFNLNPDCATVNFFGNTSVPGSVTWLWDFGDGTTSTQQNPVHTYSNTGNVFIVTLKIFTPAACNGFIPIAKQINLNRVVPDGGFYFEGQCGNSTINFFDTSTISGASINYRLWDFGDGNTSIQQNPVHTYAGVGNYTVKLTVGNTNPCGGNSIITKTVAVETQPNASFLVTGGCASSSVNFTDQSTISAGTIDLWQWDFGDGSTSALQNPQHIYSSANTYTIKLKVRSQTGCWSVETPKTITLSAKPAAKYSWQSTCVNQSTFFKDSSVISSGSISRWFWNFGDGNTSTLQNPQHTYTTAGVYTIKFIAGTSTGCNSDTLPKTITIGSKPVANFNSSYQCGIKNISFSDISANTTGAINNWYWVFGDGNNSNLQNPQHLYPNYGSYTVKLAVSSMLGCISDTLPKTVIADAKPVAQFDVTGGCINQSTGFTNNSTIEAGTINNWYWSFGDAAIGNTQNVTHTYTNNGQFQVKLVSKSANNCISDTAFKTITIEDKPVAGFSIQNGCVGTPVILQNTSTIGYGNISSYYWQFGNGLSTSTVKQPVFSYTNFGNYTVKLTATSKNGCAADTVFKPVVIESVPKVDFTFDAACAGKSVNFSNLTINDFGSINKWKWELENTVTSAAFQPAHTYNNYGDFTVKLTAATINSCSASKSKTIPIKKIDVFAGNDTIIAINQSLQLNATGASTYLWTPDLYLTDNTLPNPIAILSKDFTYYLQGTTSEGCIGFDTIKIKVFNTPDIYVPNAFTPNGDNVNDIIKPTIPGVLSLEYFSIYNRYGQLVYTTKQVGQGWNGIWQNSRQPAGAYIWICKIKDYKGNVIEKKGSVICIY
jgi:gliding motility-associated-like protein